MISDDKEKAIISALASMQLDGLNVNPIHVEKVRQKYMPTKRKVLCFKGRMKTM